MLWKVESLYSSTDIKYNCTMYHYIEGEFSMLFIIFFFMTHPLTCAKGNTIIIELQFLYVAWITRCKNLKNWVNNKILQQTYLPILCWQQYENDLTLILYTWICAMFYVYFVYTYSSIYEYTKSRLLYLKRVTYMCNKL